MRSLGARGLVRRGSCLERDWVERWMGGAWINGASGGCLIWIGDWLLVGGDLDRDWSVEKNWEVAGLDLRDKVVGWLGKTRIGSWMGSRWD